MCHRFPNRRGRLGSDQRKDLATEMVSPHWVARHCLRAFRRRVGDGGNNAGLDDPSRYRGFENDRARDRRQAERDRPRCRLSRSRPWFGRCGSAAGSDCVVDGDNFRFQGDVSRIADIDAPETRDTKCGSEAQLGARATARPASQGDFDLVQYESRARDRYGRLLRVVTQMVRRSARSLFPKARRGAGKAAEGRGAKPSPEYASGPAGATGTSAARDPTGEKQAPLPPLST
jgi:hypothetical protein